MIFFRIQQVLANLLSNAIKFTPDNGEIFLKIALIEKNDEKYRVNFSVKDNGIGISEEARNKILKPFSQADDRITRIYGGTGLGLAICEKLIALMGGSNIKIESAVNKGSIFSFDIEFSEYTDPSFNMKCVKKMFSFAVHKTGYDSAQAQRVINYISGFGHVDINPPIPTAKRYDIIFYMQGGCGNEPLKPLIANHKDIPIVFVGEIGNVDDSLKKQHCIQHRCSYIWVENI